MKLKQWLYGATALAMLAACSDKDVAPGGEVENKEPQFAKGISYLGVNIELPSESGTRAADFGDHGNDNFADGIAAEYNVDNAAILLFFGPEEETAQFVGAYTLLEDETTTPPENDNITTSFHRTIQVLNKPVKTEDSSDLLWGLALVNYDDDHFDIEDDIEDTDSYGDLTIKNAFVDENGNSDTAKNNWTLARLKDKATATPITFADFREIITDCEFLERRDNKSLKHIFMTNAPLSNVPGTNNQPEGAKIQTLASLDYTKFKSTAVDAQDNPAGCIFVERALAKVTCSSFPETTVLSHAVVNANGDISTEDVQFTIESVNWMIDNEEEKSFVVRNARNADATNDKDPFNFWQYSSINSATGANNRISYRFIGNNVMTDLSASGDNGNHNWYRTYWCIDPNYDDDKIFNKQATATTDKFEGLSKNSVSGKSYFASAKALYPHENTFDIKHQNYRNTTRVIFKVKYSNAAKIKDTDGNWVAMAGDCNLYALRGQLNNFYLRSDAQKLLKRAALSSNQIPELILQYKSPTITNTNITFSETDFVIEFNTATADNEILGIKKGDYIITKLEFQPTFMETNFQFAGDNTLESLNNALSGIKDSANKAYHIVPFTDNQCYYAVYIQHFGDTYCMLPTGWKGDEVEDVYTKSLTDATMSPENYLGRYGLVRNNWYDISVNSIGKLGNADVPKGEVDTSDDNKIEEWFLSARIHVLSWAKRTQNVDF